MKRRALIAGGAALSASLPLTPSQARAVLPHADAAILAIAAEWRRQNDAWAKAGEGKDNINDEPEADIVSGLEKQLLPLRPTTLEGFCVKMLVLTSFGDWMPPDTLLDDAEWLSGFGAYHSHPRARPAKEGGPQ